MKKIIYSVLLLIIASATLLFCYNITPPTEKVSNINIDNYLETYKKVDNGVEVSITLTGNFINLSENIIYYVSKRQYDNNYNIIGDVSLKEVSGDYISVNQKDNVYEIVLGNELSELNSGSFEYNIKYILETTNYNFEILNYNLIQHCDNFQIVTDKETSLMSNNGNILHKGLDINGINIITVNKDFIKDDRIRLYLEYEKYQPQPDQDHFKIGYDNLIIVITLTPIIILLIKKNKDIFRAKKESVSMIDILKDKKEMSYREVISILLSLKSKDLITFNDISMSEQSTIQFNVQVNESKNTNKNLNICEKYILQYLHNHNNISINKLLSKDFTESLREILAVAYDRTGKKIIYIVSGIILSIITILLNKNNIYLSLSPMIFVTIKLFDIDNYITKIFKDDNFIKYKVINILLSIIFIITAMQPDILYILISFIWYCFGNLLESPKKEEPCDRLTEAFLTNDNNYIDNELNATNVDYYFYKRLYYYNMTTESE